MNESWDVVVIGGGNAGLVAAIAARERVSRVLLLERATAALRGGNTRHTRNVRCVHDTGDVYTPGATRTPSYGATCVRWATVPPTSHWHH